MWECGGMGVLGQTPAAARMLRAAPVTSLHYFSAPALPFSHTPARPHALTPSLPPQWRYYTHDLAIGTSISCKQGANRTQELRTGSAND